MKINHVLKTIEENELFGEGTHIVLGLSGGPDSMCLFDILAKLASEMKLTVHPVHINHKFRPGAAERDCAYVEKAAREAGFPCRTFVYDCSRIAKAEGMTSEEAGRKARYQAFSLVAGQVIDELCAKEGLSREVAADRVVIAVAQNAGDQCETILFRIMRGTGVDGLSGIAVKRYESLRSLAQLLPWGSWDSAPAGLCADEVKKAPPHHCKIAIVRPLLETARKEIEEYIRENKIDARRDHTNEEAIYARNRIRLELLPYIAKSFNENIEAAVIRLGQNAALDKAYLEERAEEAFERSLIVAGSEEACSHDGEAKDKLKAKDKAKTDDCAEHGKGGAPACSPEGAGDSGVCGGSGRCGTLGGGGASSGQVVLSAKELLRLHQAIRYRVYNLALRAVGMGENVTKTHISAIDRLLHSSSPSARTELPDGAEVVRRYDSLVFRKGERAVRQPRYCMKALDYETYEAYQVGGEAAACGFFLMAEGENPSDFCVRCRCEGDYISVNSPGGGFARKKLQDFLVDEKVPKDCRNDIWVLAKGSEVLWVLPSPYFRSDTLRKKGRFTAKRRLGKNDCDSRFFYGKVILTLEIMR